MFFGKIHPRRLKFWGSLAIAYTFKYRLWILASTVILLVASLVIRQILSQALRSNLLTQGYVGVYSIETIPTDILSLATEPLITADDYGRPVGQLAANWTVSEDGKTYVVFLRDNLKWHDASQVKTKDISIAISDIKITALNDKAIEFKLPNPMSSFPLALNKPVFKVKSFYGTGEYRITSIDRLENIVRKITLVPKDKNLPRVEIKFYPTETQAIIALKMAEIKSSLVGNAESLTSWPNLEVEKTLADTEIVTILFNTEDPLFSSEKLRQALSLAINKENFDGHLATGPISPRSWAYNPQMKGVDYSPGKAKELLAKANLVNPKVALSYSPDLGKIAQQVIEDWQAIGVETEMVAEKTTPKDFQALLTVTRLMPDPDQYAFWHSTQKETNITHYKNVKIDKLLEDARSIQDEDKRKELYFDFQKFLVEDAPAIFLYHPYKYKITYKNIKPLLAKLPQ